MESFKKWFIMDLPASWAELFIRTLKVVVVGFVILQLKEYIEVGAFDTPVSLLDAVLIAGGTFVLNAVLMWTAPRGSRDRQMVRQ